MNREFGGFIDQRKNLDERLRREFGSQFKDKEQDIQKDEPELEPTLIGKENKEENKKISATTSSTTSTEHKNNQEDDKESEPTSERNAESHNNNDIKDSEKDSENLNKETEEEVKLEGEESEDLEDLVDKAKEEFKILKDPKLKEVIKKYDGIAYKGNHFTKKFIKFIKDQDSDALTKEEKDNLVKRINEFNENGNLNNLLKYYIKYTNFSQSKILRKLKYMNLKTSRNTLTKISHKILTREKYKKRFPYLPNLSDKQLEGIINADSEEQDESELINKDEYRNLMDSELQLYFKEYFEKTRKYANHGLIIRNGFKSFLESQKKIPNNVKEELINKISKINENKEIEVFLYNLFKSTNLSPREISKTFSRISLYLSTTTIRKKAKKALTPEEKKKRFPPPTKTSKDVREKIIADIKNPNSGSQRNLAKKHNVSKNKIGRIAKEVLTSEEKKKRFPPPTKLSKDVREKLIADIKDPNSGNQDDIAEKYNMSGSQIGNIAKKVLTPEERRKRFPYQTKKDLNMDAEEEIKFEDLEDLIEKAKEDFKIFKDPKLKEIIKNYDGIAYKGNHFFIRFIKFIKDQDNDALTKEEKDKLVKRIYKFNENKNINNLLIYYIKYTDLSLNKILEQLEDMNLKAPQHTLKNISHEILTQKKYEERFTANKDIISDEQREGIIKAGRSENPDTVGNIAVKWGVSYSSALIIIRNDLGEREFNKKFHTDIPQLIGLENHK